MKKSKILMLGLIALLVVVGLAFASCGSKCPGDGTSGGKGNCEVSISGVIPTVKVCTDKGCAPYKTGVTATKKVTCDC